MNKLIKISSIIILSLTISCSNNSKTNDKISENKNLSDIEFSREYFGKIDGNAIPWLIIQDNDLEEILLSEFVLDLYKYNEVNENIDYVSSSLNKYLNNEFLNNCFSNEEKNMLLKIYDNNYVIIPDLNSLYSIYGDINYEEFDFYNNDDYYAPNKQVVAKPFEITKNNKLLELKYNNDEYAKLSNINRDSRYDFANGNISYWIINQNKIDKIQNIITPTGYIKQIEANNPYIGIRPIIKIKKNR